MTNRWNPEEQWVLELACKLSSAEFVSKLAILSLNSILGLANVVIAFWCQSSNACSQVNVRNNQQIWLGYAEERDTPVRS